MRASEALLLGSTMMKPLRGEIDNGDGKGCALGMMGTAVGLQDIKFPWLRSITIAAPCGCWVFPRPLGTEPRVSDIITHLFDTHVHAPHSADKSRTWFSWKPFRVPVVPPFWTIEQIARWLDTVDPTRYINAIKYNDGLPSAEDLDAVAEEQRVAELTA